MNALRDQLNRRSPALYKVVRGAVSAVNTPLAKSRAGKALASAPRPIKLEIGGIEDRPGWVVTNVGAVTRNYLDCTARWPLEDGACSHVFSDNVIEHITLAQGRTMMAEAFRCLRPGGHIRLVTPDIRGHVELYLAGREALSSPEAEHYRSAGLVVEHPIDLVRIPIGSFGHHTGYVYDFETLEAELTRVGFTDVTRVELGDSVHPEFRGHDQRKSEGGAQIAVEATKP